MVQCANSTSIGLVFPTCLWLFTCALGAVPIPRTCFPSIRESRLTIMQLFIGMVRSATCVLQVMVICPFPSQLVLGPKGRLNVLKAFENCLVRIALIEVQSLDDQWSQADE